MFMLILRLGVAACVCLVATFKTPKNHMDHIDCQFGGDDTLFFQICI